MLGAYRCGRQADARRRRVLAAFWADRLREAADRRRAAFVACRDSAFVDTTLRPPRDLAGVLRLGAGGSFTPARRAFDNPIAIACLVERAPCLPSRTCSISSCTNAPACVLGDIPARLAARARFNVRFSGIVTPPRGISSTRRGRPAAAA
jgi:hypothetical protein